MKFAFDATLKQFPSGKFGKKPLKISLLKLFTILLEKTDKCSIGTGIPFQNTFEKLFLDDVKNYLAVIFRKFTEVDSKRVVL